MSLRGKLEALARVLPRRQVHVDGELYLDRYYLWGRPPNQDGWEGLIVPRLRLLPTAYLHHFHRPDGDRLCHNHPWHAMGRVLAGHYTEQRYAGHPADGVPTGLIKREPGEWYGITPDTFHRLARVSEGGAWTLFIIIGDKLQSWGYWDPVGKLFIPWRERCH